MKKLLPLLVLPALLLVGFGATSLFRFSEWRGNPSVGWIWTCTNSSDGSGTWSNVITGTTITADTFNMTATDSSWSIMEAGSDSLNFSNSSSGLWVELGVGSGTRMAKGFQTPSNVWSATLWVTNQFAQSVTALGAAGTNLTGLDFNNGNQFKYTLTGNVYFVKFTNGSPMQDMTFDLRQGGAGGFTVNFDTNYYKFPSGQILTAATNVGAWNIISMKLGQYATNAAVVQIIDLR